jgi:hypothetical protein
VQVTCPKCHVPADIDITLVKDGKVRWGLKDRPVVERVCIERPAGGSPWSCPTFDNAVAIAIETAVPGAAL